MRYEHSCIYGISLVGIKGYKNNSCRKCRSIKGGQPKIIASITIKNIEYLIPTTHKLYKLRGSIKNRCYNAKKSDFNSYQGKGIKMCDDWLNNAESFYKWCLLNGWREGLSIDRIDPNKDYEPSNCQFITIADNTRKSYKDNPRLGEKCFMSKLIPLQVIEIKKQLLEGKSCAEIARKFLVSPSTIKNIKWNRTWSHV